MTLRTEKTYAFDRRRGERESSIRAPKAGDSAWEGDALNESYATKREKRPEKDGAALGGREEKGERGGEGVYLVIQCTIVTWTWHRLIILQL